MSGQENNISEEKNMKIVKNILKESKDNKWPYPKTFEALKAAGLQSYKVEFINSYHTSYKGTFGTFEEDSIEGYKALKLSKEFSAEGVKNAIIKHMKEHTHFLDFFGRYSP